MNLGGSSRPGYEFSFDVVCGRKPAKLTGEKEWGLRKKCSRNDKVFKKEIPNTLYKTITICLFNPK